jgi:hypothetical protein
VSRARDEYPSRGFIDRRWHTHIHTNTLGLYHTVKTYILARLEPRLKAFTDMEKRKIPWKQVRLISVNKESVLSSSLNTYFTVGKTLVDETTWKDDTTLMKTRELNEKYFLIYSACLVARVTLLCSRAQEISHTHTHRHRVTHSHTPLQSSMNSLSRLRKMIGKGHDDDLGYFSLFPLFSFNVLKNNLRIKYPRCGVSFSPSNLN